MIVGIKDTRTLFQNIVWKGGENEMLRKRLLLMSLALALVLTALTPAVALAAKPVPLEANGTITSITPGDVFPAGESGRWRVIERDITGNLSGAISGDFTMTYKANVELATQAGNLHGTLEAGESVLNVNGKIEPLDIVYYKPWDTYLPKLTISGHWNFLEGARGQGDFDASAIFVPTPEGHVAFIIASSFKLTGKWQP